MNFKAKVSDILHALARPVRSQCVFFVMSFLMIVYPVVKGVFDPYCTLDLRIFYFFQGLLIALGVSWSATALVHKVGKGWLKTLMYAFFWILLTITLLLEFNFGWNISEEAVTIMFETNPNETGEFLETYAFTTGSIWSYSISLAALAIVIVSEWLKRRRARHRADAVPRPGGACYAGVLWLTGVLYMLVCYVTLALSGNSLSMERWAGYFPHNSLDIVSQTLDSFNAVRAGANDVSSAVDEARKVYETHPTIEGNDSLTVVYVLGESYNKHHASLYGYPLQTTPNLERERDNGNLIVFNDAITFENYTSIVQKNSFSLNCVSEGQRWFKCPMFTTVFKRSGYDVWMWDMQRDYSPGKLVTITVNSMMYNEEIMEKSYTACNDTSFTYDGQMVEDFASKVKFKSPHNLVVFHLIGQHVSYHFRYPKDKRRFGTLSYDRHEPFFDQKASYAVTHYDNATYYNDMVMEQIFDLFRDRNAVVVYMSDHGEEVYDYRGKFGRHQHAVPTFNEMRYQNEVPFMIWCSDRYKELHPDVVKRMQEAVDRPFVTDIIGHILLGLGNVKSEYYSARHDILSPQFKPCKRIIHDCVDYDKAIGRK